MLTKRQIEVLDRFCEGQTDAEIATDLVVEESTVRRHLHSICVAFGLTDPPNCQHRDELRELCYQHCYNLKKETTHPDNTCGPSNKSGLVAFTVNGCIDPAAVKKLQSILRVLQTISDDITIDIEDIEQGSIRLILNGSPEGLERLEALFRAGELSEIAGISVENVQLITTQTSENREDRQTRKRLALTIAGHIEPEDLAKLKAAICETDRRRDARAVALPITEAQTLPASSPAVLDISENTSQTLTLLFKELGGLSQTPSIPPLAAQPQTSPILEEIENWAKTDADGDLRNTHIKGHPQANCQILILRRLPPSTPWKDISRELKLPIATLSCFYQRKCLPRLKKFGEEQGYWYFSEKER